MMLACLFGIASIVLVAALAATARSNEQLREQHEEDTLLRYEALAAGSDIGVDAFLRGTQAVITDLDDASVNQGTPTAEIVAADNGGQTAGSGEDLKVDAVVFDENLALVYSSIAAEDLPEPAALFPPVTLEAMRAGTPTLTNVADVGDRPRVGAAVPVTQDDGSVIFVVLYADGDLTTPFALAPPGEMIYSVDPSGTGFSHQDGSIQSFGDKPIAVPEDTETELVNYARAGEELVAFVAPLDSLPGWSIVGEKNAEEFYAAIDEGMSSARLFTLISIGTAFVICALLAGRALITHRRGTRRFESLVANTADAVSVLDRDLCISFDNPAVQRVFGQTPKERLKNPYSDYIHGDDRHAFDDLVRAASLRPGVPTGSELRLVPSDSAADWVELTVTDLVTDGAINGYLVSARDVTDREYARQTLEWAAKHDTLTGLPNRLAFEEKYAEAVEEARRSESGVALAFVDIDGLKEVNDELGHDAGDELLRAAADRLRHCVRSTDMVARLGGDEFVALLPGVRERAEVSLVTDRIEREFEAPVTIGEYEVATGASVGTATAFGAIDGQALLRRADEAMYAAKRARRSTRSGTPADPAGS
ncbi:MAG: diguanylate cyclase [Actinobacteria bacterium]|nr:MAG: diguanylate cyclase [Actinomycetota bacterium]RIK04584.1 MAG: hypothetical protein DCC48_12795 [Acidobacteriota bacterium]